MTMPSAEALDEGSRKVVARLKTPLRFPKMMKRGRRRLSESRRVMPGLTVKRNS